MWLKWLYNYVYTVSKINDFIMQGYIKLVESDSKDVYII